jgi:hypothetical protein
MIEKLLAKYVAERALRYENLRILLKNPVGVAEHPDFADTIEVELHKIAGLNDLIEACQLLPNDLK